MQLGQIAVLVRQILVLLAPLSDASKTFTTSSIIGQLGWAVLA